MSLIECLRIRINKLEQERKVIAKQLNELKEKQFKTTSKGKQQNIKQYKEYIPKSRKKSTSKNRVSDTERKSKSKPPLADKSKPPKTQLSLLETTGLLPNNNSNSFRRKLEYKMTDTNQEI